MTRIFAASLRLTLSRLSNVSLPAALRGGFRGTSSRRLMTGFVLLAFGLTQIFTPMVLLAAGRLSSKNTPPDSFLRTQVDSVPDLVSEIQHNVKIRRNYAHHFGLPSNQIANYIRQNLTIRTLHRAYRHIVYCVRPDGVFFYVNQTMPAGTKVFALKQSGRPVLKWACGNPFTKRLPHPDAVVTFLRRSKPHVTPREVTASDVEVITPDEAAAIVPTEAVAPSTEVIGALPLTPATYFVPAALVHGGGGSLLPFLPLIPVLFGIGGGGGGSNGGSPTGSTGGSTGGSTATTGGATSTTGGSTATTGGTTSTTGGSTATTGGTTSTTGGSTATTGGTTSTTGGSTETTGGTTSTTTTGGTTASVVPEPGGSSTVGYAFLVLAGLAFASSIRRKRRSQG